MFAKYILKQNKKETFVLLKVTLLPLLSVSVLGKEEQKNQTCCATCEKPSRSPRRSTAEELDRISLLKHNHTTTKINILRTAV